MARIWRHSNVEQIEIPDPKDHGWTESGEIRWILNAFPYEIEMILLSDSVDEGDLYVEGEDDSDESDLDE